MLDCKSLVRDLFAIADTNKDGVIDRHELSDALLKNTHDFANQLYHLGVSDRYTFEYLDTNSDGKITEVCVMWCVFLCIYIRLCACVWCVMCDMSLDVI